MAFRDYILDRFWLKLFAFILATLIWFTASTQNGLPSIRNPWSVEREITRPVRLLVLPTTRRSFSIQPVEVRITVRGSSAALNRLSPNEVQAQVNLTDAVDSAASYFVEARNVPRTVEVVQIVPSWVMVEPRAN